MRGIAAGNDPTGSLLILSGWTIPAAKTAGIPRAGSGHGTWPSLRVTSFTHDPEQAAEGDHDPAGIPCPSGPSGTGRNPPGLGAHPQARDATVRARHGGTFGPTVPPTAAPTPQTRQMPAGRSYPCTGRSQHPESAVSMRAGASNSKLISLLPSSGRLKRAPEPDHDHSSSSPPRRGARSHAGGQLPRGGHHYNRAGCVMQARPRHRSHRGRHLTRRAARWIGSAEDQQLSTR